MATRKSSRQLTALEANPVLELLICLFEAVPLVESNCAYLNRTDRM